MIFYEKAVGTPRLERLRMKQLIIAIIISLLSPHTYSADRGIITRAESARESMRSLAYKNYLHEKKARGEVKVWANAVESAKRVLNRYYLLDKFRYKAQVIFEVFRWTGDSATYKDSKKAESMWLGLMRELEPRIAISNSHNKKKGTNIKDEVTRSRSHWDWAVADEARAKKAKERLIESSQTTIYHKDAKEILTTAQAETLFARKAYIKALNYFSYTSDYDLRERLNTAYKRADDYLAQQIAYYYSLELVEEKQRVELIRQQMKDMVSLQELLKLLTTN